MDKPEDEPAGAVEKESFPEHTLSNKSKNSDDADIISDHVTYADLISEGDVSGSLQSSDISTVEHDLESVDVRNHDNDKVDENVEDSPLSVIKDILENVILEEVVKNVIPHIERSFVPEVLDNTKEMPNINKEPDVVGDIAKPQLNISTGPLSSDEESENEPIETRFGDDQEDIKTNNPSLVEFEIEMTQDIEVYDSPPNSTHADIQKDNSTELLERHSETDIIKDKTPSLPQNLTNKVPSVEFHIQSAESYPKKAQFILQRQEDKVMSTEEVTDNNQLEQSLDPTLTTTSELGSLEPHISAGEVIAFHSGVLRSEGEISHVIDSGPSSLQPTSDISSSESEAGRLSSSASLSSRALLSSLSEGEWRASPQQLQRLANMAQSFRIIP